MGRPSNTIERRKQITDALLRLMAEKGYNGASIQAIAKAASLTPGLVHYHFKTKQEILIAAVTQVANVAEQRYLKLLNKATTPRARLEAFLNARLATGKGADRDAVAAWVFIGAEAVRQPEVRMAYEEIMAKQLEILSGHIAEFADSPFPPKKLKALSGIVLAAMEGAFQLAVTSQNIMPKNYAAKMVLDIICSYIQQEKGAAADLPER